jgi:hypothetical protein
LILHQASHQKTSGDCKEIWMCWKEGKTSFSLSPGICPTHPAFFSSSLLPIACPSALFLRWLNLTSQRIPFCSKSRASRQAIFPSSHVPREAPDRCDG